MKNEQRKISIVMPTYNGIGTIESAIESIFEKTTYPNFELIVIDDGSTDKTQDWVLNYKKNNNLSNLNCFRFNKNNGICTALNKGFELAQPNDIIRIDNDVIVLIDDWIERFIKTAYSDEKIGIVSAKPLRDLRKVDSYEILAITMDYVSYPKWGASHNIFKGIKEIESNVLSCAYIKNKLTKLITNDENYNPCWIEDIDYCINARYHGFKVVIDTNIVVHHVQYWKNRDHSKFEGKKKELKEVICIRNLIYFQKKWWKFKDRTFIRKKYAECPEIIKFITLKDIIKKNFNIFYYDVCDRALGRAGIFLQKHLPVLYRLLKGLRNRIYEEKYIKL